MRDNTNNNKRVFAMSLEDAVFDVLSNLSQDIERHKGKTIRGKDEIYYVVLSRLFDQKC